MTARIAAALTTAAILAAALWLLWHAIDARLLAALKTP